MADQEPIPINWESKKTTDELIRHWGENCRQMAHQLGPLARGRNRFTIDTVTGNSMHLKHGELSMIFKSESPTLMREISRAQFNSMKAEFMATIKTAVRVISDLQ